MPQRDRAAIWTFVALTALLTVPFWLTAAVIGLQLLPGLPVSALAAVCPGAAALLLVLREGGPPAAERLIALLVRPGRSPSAWLWIALGAVAPFAVNGVALAIQAWGASHAPALAAPPAEVFELAIVFVVAACAEELGWTAFATWRLEGRGVLGAGLTVGAVWAVWHYPALLQAHRSLGWIAWWTLGTVAARVAMTAIFVRSRRGGLGAVLLHAAVNLSWQLYPVHGSTYDPAISGLVMVIVAGGFLVAQPRPRLWSGNGQGLLF